MKESSGFKRSILKLRKQGKSYNDIAKKLGVAKSTVSYWAASNPESQRTKILLTEQNNLRSKRRAPTLQRAAQKKWRMWREEARQEAIREFPFLVKNSLFVASIAFYWGEGDRMLKYPLRLSNTDPRMIRLYVSFLREILKLPDKKIRLHLILYPDLSERLCKKYWKEITDLKETNFTKTQFINCRHPTRRLSRGICAVTVSSKRHKIKVLEWIDLFHKKYKVISPRA